MGKFIRDILTVLLAGVILITAVNFAYLHLNLPEKEIDKFEDMPEKIRVCNVGSSHGKNSFAYDEYEGVGCFNFGLTSQRYQYDYRLIENYIDRFEEGAVVLIPYSYFSLWGTDDEQRSDFESMNNRYYKILPKDKIIGYEPWVDICYHYYPVLTAYDELIDAIKDTVLGEGDNASFDEKQIDISKDAVESLQSQIVSNRDAEGNSILNEERLEALEAMIELCKNKGLRPVLITTPLTKTLTDLVKEKEPDFLEYFYGFADDLCEKYDLEYYDYSCDERLYDNYDLFIDSHHLNKEGAKLFTRIVMEEVARPGEI